RREGVQGDRVHDQPTARPMVCGLRNGVTYSKIEARAEHGFGIRTRTLSGGFNMRWSLYLSLVLGSLPATAQDPRYANKLSPYVASPLRVVDRMLDLAKVKPGETLYDLGCGDGIILVEAVRKYQVKAVGVEISPKLVAKAEERIEKAGLREQARVIQGDLLKVDLTGADVVTLYLSTPLNAELRP